MTSSPPAEEPERQWQQPAFPTEGADNTPFEGQVYSGSSPSAALVPRRVALPPSVAETVLATVSGVVWPVMIVLAIAGVIGWWSAVIIALVTGVVLDNTRRHLRARRRALAATIDAGDAGEEGLR